MEEYKKPKVDIKELLLPHIIRGTISILIALTFFFSIYFGMGMHEVDLCNGLFIGGAVVLGIYLLTLLNYFGAFDLFGYSFSTIGVKYFPHGKKKYDDYYSYTEIKKEKRKKDQFNFVAYLVVGLIFVIASIIVQIIIHK